MSLKLETHPGRPLQELRSTGLLWLINRVVFHPRGFSLALETDEQGEVIGWRIFGDGTATFTFTDRDDDESFQIVTAFLDSLTAPRN